ncbi:MAG: hypothetical protein KGD66_09050, partial [Candidatus Lokiarchaeota archaeon]|nr:hypothetical protein [Candidatus Lokiarchaeota archaeon]
MVKIKPELKNKLDLKKTTLRRLFLHLEKEKANEVASNLEERLQGMVYIQMRLPIEKITKQYEDNVKKKIEANIYQAKIREASLKDLEIVTNIYNKSWLTSRTPFRPIEKETLKTIFQHKD